MKKMILAAALAISAIAAGPVAQAGNVDVGISIGIPGVVLGAPAYYPPPPRYYQPRPVVVVPQPVYVAPRPVWRGRGHYDRRVSDRRGGKHWNGHRGPNHGHRR